MSASPVLGVHTCVYGFLHENSDSIIVARMMSPDSGLLCLRRLVYFVAELRATNEVGAGKSGERQD